jgi:hypothetical protein
VLADRFHQVVEGRFDELMARLQRAGDDVVERHVADAFEVVRRDQGVGYRWSDTFFNECSESFSECLFRHGGGSITQSRREIQAEFSQA